MPNRWMAAGIVAFWGLMMGLLVQRDVLPHWRVDQKPDFRAVARAVEDQKPVRWAVLEGERRIGWAQTEWHQFEDGRMEFRSQLDLKTVPLLSTFAPGLGDDGLRWESVFYISSEGNLERFEIDVFWAQAKPSMTVHGKVMNDILKVSCRSGAFSYDEQFYYEPHSLMTASLSPIDKLPNLSVGQTWQHRVMNPLLRSTDVVRCRVASEQVITWRGDPVPTYVVEQIYGQVRARCWVSHDGTVLRQEVPLGWTPLVLEHE